jgi:uncharacterized circularly permuted ATP-grasp superfamily protein/uncharacterized alpha-E superfamily protein
MPAEMTAVTSASAPLDLAAGYAPPANGYDELKSAGGDVRPHWRKLLAHVERLAGSELERRWDKASQLLHQNGVSYNVYGDPQGMERPWSLSPLPVVLPADEWQQLERDLAQRARLLDALLCDLYGPQRVLGEGLLPPELVFENPGFLRPCHGVAVPRQCFLPLLCADVVRLPSGRFAVMEDRTQAPSGAGYALENRIVISSALPEAFRDCNVERVSLFFRTLRDTLQSLAPHNRDNPRVVLLTPGPYNATYFEQAYLAQYLGYTLANGGDLTVRDERVYLKTLGGLLPVDVVLRRVNDDFCDPLELRADSILGVPGLVQAVRSGNVAIANPLGAGLLHTPTFLPYLERLCSALLGETLRLPSVRTFWCGDPAMLREACADFADVIVKPAFAGGFVKPVFTAHLNARARAELLAQIHERPRQYVIQEHVRASTTPVLAGRALQPKALVLRCFGVAGPNDYAIMPGALARVAGTEEGTELSMQLGAGSKDTWVLSRGAVSEFSLLPPVNRPVALSRGGTDLPSRATDNLYWLGRYSERAEGVARLVRVVAKLLSDLTSQNEFERGRELAPLLRTVTAQTAPNYTAPLGDDTAANLAAAEQQLWAAVFDEQVPGSLEAVTRAVLRAGRLVRDRISTDTWRVLAALDDELHAAAARGQRGDPLGTLQEVASRVILRLAAISGLVMDGMTRGHAFRFLDMGRRIERAMSMITLLRAGLCEPCDRQGPLLEAVLEVADSGMTYRRRYLATLQVAPVVDLLLTDETNPRSVLYQMQALARHIAELPRAEHALRSPEERIALGVLADLQLTDIEWITPPDEHGRRARLSELLVDLATRIPALSDSLSERYLSHAGVSRHLGEGKR